MHIVLVRQVCKRTVEAQSPKSFSNAEIVTAAVAELRQYGPVTAMDKLAIRGIVTTAISKKDTFRNRKTNKKTKYKRYLSFSPDDSTRNARWIDTECANPDQVESHYRMGRRHSQNVAAQMDSFESDFVAPMRLIAKKPKTWTLGVGWERVK